VGQIRKLSASAAVAKACYAGGATRGKVRQKGEGLLTEPGRISKAFGQRRMEDQPTANFHTGGTPTMKYRKESKGKELSRQGKAREGKLVPLNHEGRTTGFRNLGPKDTFPG